MRYVGLGTLGYGLQIAAYLVYAITSALLFTNAFNLGGLNVLSLLTPIPGLLIGLTWLYAGKDRRVSLFTATGLIGLIIFGLSLASTLLTWILVPENGVIPLNPTGSPQLIAISFELAAFAAVVGLIAITHFILETISFFSAGKNFQEKMFRFAGWSRIFAIMAAGVLFIVIIFLGVLSALSGLTGSPPGNLVALQFSPGLGSQFTSLFGLALGGVYAILAVPEAFALLGFRRLRVTIAAGLLRPTITSVPSTSAQPGAKFCSSCGAATTAGSRFCSNCGNPLL